MSAAESTVVVKVECSECPTVFYLRPTQLHLVEEHAREHGDRALAARDRTHTAGVQVTYGEAGGKPRVVLILTDEAGAEHVEHMEPEWARGVAIRLIELAHRIENPKPEEWP